MGRMRSLPLIVFLSCVFVVFGGCAGGMKQNIPRPAMELESVTLSDLSLQSVEFQWNVKVSNPYWVSLPLTRMQYEFLTRDTQILSGNVESPEPIPAGESSTIPVKVRVPFSDLWNRLQNLETGQVIPYTGRVHLTVKPPVLGSLSLSTETRSEFPLPAPPRLKFRRLQWERLSLTSAAARLDLDLYNPNSFSFDLRSFSYGIQLAGKSVADNRLGRSVSFDPNQSRTVPLEFSFSPMQFGTALFQTLTGNRGKLQLKGQMVLDTRFGTLEIPLDQQETVSFVSP